jgi:Zn-dependent peptidase ImmA (M78 family)
VTRRERLYCFIDRKRQSCGLTPADVPVDPMALAAREGPALVVERRPFSRRGLGGVLFKGKVSLITLNSLRGPEETRFSLAHELIHYWCDEPGGEAPPRFDLDPGGSGTLRLRETPAFSEWRANEGAAELLVPRAFFIPLAAGEALAAHHGSVRALEQDAPWRTQTAALFGVTEPVIRYRLRSLRGWIEGAVM